MPKKWRVTKPWRMIILVYLGVVAASCGNAGNARSPTVILVSAAASLQDGLTDIVKAYEIEHPNVKIHLNYGSSGTLQKQIEQGAPADLFLSAGSKQMDALISKKLVKNSENALSNRLVLVVPADLAVSWDDLEPLLDPKFSHIAIGEPDNVPAGIYARQTLTDLHLWDKLQPKLVYAQNVRQVLTYVETGNADAGFVYRTDAMSSRKSKIALEMPEQTHEPIVYPFGLLAASKHLAEAADFYRYLFSDPATEVFRKHGFVKPQ